MIKLRQIVAKIRELAQNAPHNLYDSALLQNCYYLSRSCTDGSVGCIVGQALVGLGVDLRSVLVKDGKEDTMKASVLIIKLVDAKIIDDNELHHNMCYQWIGKVQAMQDNGFSWGKAVEETDGYFPLPVSEKT